MSWGIRIIFHNINIMDFTSSFENEYQSRNKFHNNVMYGLSWWPLNAKMCLDANKLHRMLCHLLTYLHAVINSTEQISIQ